MILTDTRPAESGHWYDRDGRPTYEVESAKGGYRPTTLRDARKLLLAPSVTTVSRCAAAPQLEVWKVRQAILAALTHPGLKGTDEDVDIILRDSREQARKAAEHGTRVHAAIQGYYESRAPQDQYRASVEATAFAIEAKFGKQQWIAEASFAHPLGFGGKVDLHCPLAVLDFKTKEFTDETKRLAWDEHCIQIAAYRYGLGFPAARGGNVFVSTTKSGLAVVHEWPEDELLNGWRMFVALLDYWKAKNRFESGWPA